MCSCVCHQWQIGEKADLCLTFILAWYRITITTPLFFHRQEGQCEKLCCYNYYSCSLIWLISDMRLKKNTDRKAERIQEAEKYYLQMRLQSHIHVSCTNHIVVRWNTHTIDTVLSIAILTTISLDKKMKHTHNRHCAEYCHLDNHLFR